jgi:Malectin domain
MQQSATMPSSVVWTWACLLVSWVLVGGAQGQLVPPPPLFAPILINSGGDQYTDTTGRVWSADKWFVGGTIYAKKSGDIKGTKDNIVYRNSRVGECTYDVPVPNGSYEVVLHFADVAYVYKKRQLSGSDTLFAALFTHCVFCDMFVA